MDLVPKLLTVNVAEFFMVFAYILQIQLCKSELKTRQVFIAWIALALYFYTFTKQVYAFFLGFQRMVASSKVELNAASDAEHQFILSQAATTFIGASLIFYNFYATSSTVFYFVYVLGITTVILLTHAYMIY